MNFRRSPPPNLIGLVAAGIEVHKALTERDAAVARETRALVAAEVHQQIQDAYEQGWRDACDDHLEQGRNPMHPIGRRKQHPYVAKGAQ